MTTFSELGLSSPILKSLDELGFKSPTEIQQQAIPLLSGKSCDFIGLAQTGTGKTAAFGLPLLQNIDYSDARIQSLILAPTRELAQQIAVGLQDFGKHINGLNVQVVYGGADISKQIRQLRSKVNVVVATPGRLLDLIKRKALSLEAVRFVVLDEADEMLNMGFKEDLNKILSFMPEEKSTWLFSATMPSAIKNIVKHYMTDPVKVTVNADTKVNVNISHQYMLLKASDKQEAIKRLLDFNEEIYGVIFCRTKMDTTELAESLRRSGYSADAINGDLSQNQRDVVMKRFKSHSIKLLVATDVAARGIDVNDLTHVIHYRLPDEMEYYTHRSGRTARAGKKGISLVLATRGDLKQLRFFESRLKISFEKREVPKLESIRSNKIMHWATSIVETPETTDITPEEWESVKATLENFDKDQLINKLLSRELSKMKKFESGGADLNMVEGRGRDSGRTRERGGERRGERSGERTRERSGERRSTSSRDRDKGVTSGYEERVRSRDKERSPKSNSEEGFSKFFINIGKMDGATKPELLDFIVEETGLDKKAVGDISIEKMGSYFEVKNDDSNSVTNNFKGIIVNGRDVKVKEERGDRSRRPDNRGKGRRD